MQQNPDESFVEGINEAIERMRQAPGATMGIVWESQNADYIMANPQNCNFYTVGHLANRYFGIALPKSEYFFKCS